MRVLQGNHDATGMPSRTGSGSSIGRRAGRFGLHFVEMCIVMCVGGGVLIGLFFGAAVALGFPELRSESPVLSALVVSVLLAGAMVAWMRLRRMAWRPTLEMAASAVSSGVVLVVAYGLGAVSAQALVPSVCLLACGAMLAVMVFRIPLYAPEAGHHHAAHHR